jgi:alginate O-acetyltransferase complex protein AlgJ
MRFMNARERGELAIVLMFAALLVFPAIAFATGASTGNAAFIVGAERRTVATMPPQSELTSRTGAYTRGLENVIADDFPFRTAIIEGYDWTKYVLGDSSSERVLRGRDGWLFLGEPAVRAYITGANRPDDAALDYIVQVYRSRADFCRAHGARYLLVFPPDKSSIYPEKLPAGIALVHPTTLERLIPRLRAAGVEVVDAAPAIDAAKSQGEVYSHGDTHWNSRGAYAAYRVLADALRPSGVKPIDPGLIHERVSERAGDLLRMSGVSRLFLDRQIDLTFVQRAKRVETPEYAETALADHPELQPYATVVGDGSLPTAVLFGDSFAQRLWPFLDEGFRRALHVRTATQVFNDHLIVAEHPNVVVQEFVERGLTAPQEE